MSPADRATQAGLVEGFMLQVDLDWLADQASRRLLIVELGSWKGRSTVALSATPGTVVAVDRWDGVLDGRAAAPDVYGDFLRNTEPYGNIAHIRCATDELEPNAFLETAVPVDMVFIDASHAHDDVLRDIRLAYALLHGKGLICGHDWGVVHRAVDELVPWAALVGGGDIWWKQLR